MEEALSAELSKAESKEQLLSDLTLHLLQGLKLPKSILWDRV